MKNTLIALGLLSLLETGALFGFFYAWVCSTMWGLDAADPRTAIAAMQAMNASVRNAVFAPVFFGTPLVLALTAGVFWRSRQQMAAAWFGAAACVIAIFAVGLTAVVNVPMNEALALVAVPQDLDAARAIWAAYSPDWQFWNQTRTIASGLGLIMVGAGLLNLRSA